MISDVLCVLVFGFWALIVFDEGPSKKIARPRNPST